jgi:hypothetical protein
VTSPVLSAVYRGDRAAVDRLLAEGETLTICEAAALGDAARVREAVIDALLDARADVRAYSHNTLLAHGADPDVRADGGKAALAIAEEREHALAARRLRGELP